MPDTPGQVEGQVPLEVVGELIYNLKHVVARRFFPEAATRGEPSPWRDTPWSALTEEQRRTCLEYLAELFEFHDAPSPEAEWEDFRQKCAEWRSPDEPYRHRPPWSDLDPIVCMAREVEWWVLETLKPYFPEASAGSSETETEEG